MKLITLILTTLIIASCVHGTKTVKPSEVICYGVDPLYHTVYIGSDKNHHYFRYAKGKVNGSWKVKKEDLVLSETFSTNSGSKQFVERNKSGQLVLVNFKK